MNELSPTIRQDIIPGTLMPTQLIQIQDLTTAALDAMEDFSVLACGHPAWMDCSCEMEEQRQAESEEAAH